ncbi:hypothetical protein QO206_13435 [Leeuwenhoekiella aequorea]|uniref:hypothetical protein n=1 Tax=Leeuwenhoekiella aequorea TaxID=283736 RepID=UPI00352D0DAA|tara:strand:+ start:4434 stop:4907 length:474 start_codon:yes stop_codon:yes gene_type:complete
MSKLIDLSERVDELGKPPIRSHAAFKYAKAVWKHNNFLKTDLLSNYFVDGKEHHFLNRFVPCDLSGLVLKEPRRTNIQDANYDIDAMETYQDHKSKVWFEGFELTINNSYFLNSKESMGQIEYNPNTKRFYFGLKTISDLTPLNLTLTPFGSKQAGI